MERSHGCRGIACIRSTPSVSITGLRSEPVPQMIWMDGKSYQKKPTRKMRGGLYRMCNLGDAIEARGIRKGEKIGEKRGEKREIKMGVDRVNQLNMLLLTDNRIEDMKKAAGNAAYQKQLFVEFGL